WSSDVCSSDLSARTEHHQQPAWPPVPAGRHTTYKSLSAGYPARNTSASPHGCFGGRQRTENGSPGRLCREIFRGFPQDRSLFFQPLHIRPQRPLIGPQRIVLDPQASKLLLGCLGPIRRARGHLASFLPRLEHPRLDRATGDAKIGRDLGIRHIGMSLVQRDGVGFELIGVLLLWHGFYSHSPAHYGPDSACPPLRVHPRCCRCRSISTPTVPDYRALTSCAPL